MGKQQAYNFIENTHQIWLLTIVDLIIGKREYPQIKSMKVVILAGGFEPGFPNTPIIFQNQWYL